MQPLETSQHFNYPLRQALSFNALLLVCFALASCTKQSAIRGSLFIHSPSSDSFEIFRVTSEQPFQYVSEHAGNYNTQINLVPGKYLVLADCSSQLVVISPGQTTKLIAGELEFIAPEGIDTNTSDFNIQCQQSQLTNAKQTLSNQYKLNLITGKHDILVGMVPYKINMLDESQPNIAFSKSVKLGAIKVSSQHSFAKKPKFFVSPTNQLIDTTASQVFGQWILLLEGNYNIEVNGSKLAVGIKSGETKEIETALFTAETSEAIDLGWAEKVKGSPHLLKINDEHNLRFNEKTALLSSPQSIRIEGSSRTKEISLEPNEEFKLDVRSITVKRGCSPWEWNCLGKTEVLLYEDEQPYPFVESISDMPILLFDSDQPLWVGLDGSRDLKYKVNNAKSDVQINTGILKLVPMPAPKTNQITDLVRVESLGQNFSGNSLDISLTKVTEMPLITGSYLLSTFNTLSTQEGERRKTSRKFQINPNEVMTLKFKAYLSEKAYKRWVSTNESEHISTESVSIKKLPIQIRRYKIN